MTNIFVNLQSLWSSAKEIGSVGELIHKVGSVLSGAGHNAPSYDGQFGPWVQGISSDANGKAKFLGIDVGDLGGRVGRKADQFFAVDNESIVGATLAQFKVNEWFQNHRILSWFMGLFGINNLSIRQWFRLLTLVSISSPGDLKYFLILAPPIVAIWYGKTYGIAGQTTQSDASASIERKKRGEDLVKKYDGSKYAEGTYDEQDSYSSHLVNPPVTNMEGDRDPNIYNAVLNQFGVEDNPRYIPRGKGTYCNIYVWDATKAMGAEIPHWVDAGTGAPTGVGAGRELDANNVASWLADHGNNRGWHTVSAEAAQQSANGGSPAIAVWQNKAGIGHIAMVRPGEYAAATGPTTAQAGAENYNNTTVSATFEVGWGNNEVVYYAHN